jgi:hypothetical protein
MKVAHDMVRDGGSDRAVDVKHQGLFGCARVRQQRQHCQSNPDQDADRELMQMGP